MKNFLKDNPRLAAAGAAGLVVFLALFGRAFMTGVRPQPLDRDQVTARVLDFTALEGWAVSPRVAWTYPIEGDDFAIARDVAAASGVAMPRVSTTTTSAAPASTAAS